MKVEFVEGWIDIDKADFGITFQIFGDIPKLGIGGPGRRDGLWQSTCFEVFLKPDQTEAYLEFNFTPRGGWAAYSFENYRQGQKALQVSSPRMEPIEAGFRVIGTFGIPISSARLGISAVIEELDGTKSYWALAHPPGQPDFHHPTCFAATLPPPSNT